MSHAARGRLAVVVAVALVIAMVAPATGLANGSGKVAPAGVKSAAVMAPDAYESVDDTWTTAPVLPTTSWHSFDSSATDPSYTNDNDWFKVTVTATGTPIFIDGYNVNSGSVDDADFDVMIHAFESNASGVCSVAAMPDPLPGAAMNGDTAWDADQLSDGLGNGTFAGSWESDYPMIYFVAPHPGTYYFRLGMHHNNDSARDWVPTYNDCAGGGWLHVIVGDARRISGADRYGTANAVVTQMWNGADPDWWTPPHGNAVIVASGANYADALSAGVMSLMSGMPLLLTPPTALPASVKSLIAYEAAPNYWNDDEFTVYIVGGTSAVSTAVENDLKSIEYVSQVTRLAGATRYGTATKIADEASATIISGSMSASRVFLVSGLNFADALAAGPVAAWGGAPILMTAPTVATSETIDWMKSNNTTEVIVAGGPSAIATSVLNTIQASVPGTQTFTRLAGADRYETSYKVAQHGVAYYGMEGSSTIVVSGTGFADGLAAAQLSYFWWSPVLLTPPAVLSPWVQKFYEANDGFNNASFVVGGPAAVSEAAYVSLRDMWKKPF